MSILEIDDILYEIINHINIKHIKTIVSLVIINKSCHYFIINLKIYKELCVLQKRFPNFYDYANFCGIELLCELNLINVLKKVLIHDPKYHFNEIITSASKHNRVNLLQYFTKHNHEIPNFESAMNVAVKYGHVNVLEWFYELGYKFKNCKIAIKTAMENGQIDVVKWFCNMGYRIEYSNRYVLFLDERIQHISKHDHPWFYNEDYIYKYTEADVEFIIRNDHFDLLKWLFELNNGFKLSDALVNFIVANNYIHILDWIKNKGFDIQYASDILICSCNNDNVNVLEWLQKNEIIIKITPAFVVRATIYGYIGVLDFLNTNELDYYHWNNIINANVISEFKHFKNFVYSICWKHFQHFSCSYNIGDFVKYECSLNWYTKSGFNLGQIEWIQHMKIEKYPEAYHFYW